MSRRPFYFAQLLSIIAAHTLFIHYPERPALAGIRTVALSTDEVPGADEHFFNLNLLSSAKINDDGEVLFRTGLSGPAVGPTNDIGVFFDSPNGSPTMLVREGDPAPGFDGAVISSLSAPCCSLMGTTLNNMGDATLLAAVASSATGSPMGDALYSSSRGGEIQLKVRTGDPIAGLPDTVFAGVRRFYVEDDLAFNDAGRVAFVGYVQPAEGGPQQEAILALDSTVGLQKLVGVGESAPGASGASYSRFSSVDLNSPGNVLFRGQLQGEGVAGTNDEGFWASRGDTNLVMLAREGIPVPTAMNKTYRGFNSVAATTGNGLNDNDQAAFMGFVGAGPTDVLLSDPVEGLTAVVGSSTVGGLSAHIWDFNNAGQLLFRASGSTLLADSEGNLEHVTNEPNVGRLTEDGEVVFTLSSGLGIAAYDPRIGIRTIVGDELDVDDGPAVDLKQIVRVSLLDVSTLGYVAFSATFADGGAGIFVSNALVVPEPNTLSLLILSILCSIGRSRRR